MRFELHPQSSWIVIHNDLKRLGGRKMLEETKKYRVTMLRVDVDNMDHALIDIGIGHD